MIHVTFQLLATDTLRIFVILVPSTQQFSMKKLNSGHSIEVAVLYLALRLAHL